MNSLFFVTIIHLYSFAPVYNVLCSSTINFSEVVSSNWFLEMDKPLGVSFAVLYGKILLEIICYNAYNEIVVYSMCFMV